MNFTCFQTLEELEAIQLSVAVFRLRLNFTSLSGVLPNEPVDQPVLSALLKYARVLLYVLLIVVSLVGNLLVIVVIAADRVMRKKALNYFLLNLALCDLAVLASCMWVELVNVNSTNNWVLGEMFCKVRKTDNLREHF